MGEALIRGLLQAGVVGPAEVLAADIDPDRRAYLARQYGIAVTGSNVEVAVSCPTVILAVKPQVAAAVLREVGDKFRPGQLFLSIVAGWKLSRLESFLPPEVAMVRAMPNTPCLIGQGITALAYGRGVTGPEQDLARSIFGAVGEVVELPEHLLDAVTALSGCGPAYAFLVIEALTDAGVKLGLPRQVALKLTTQTIAGAAAMVGQTGTHPAQLKDMVTSPGGATIYGLAVMEEAGLRGTLIKAVFTAWQRAQALGKEES